MTKNKANKSNITSLMKKASGKIIIHINDKICKPFFRLLIRECLQDVQIGSKKYFVITYLSLVAGFSSMNSHAYFKVKNRFKIVLS